MGKRIIHDVKTGSIRVEDFDLTPEMIPADPAPIKIDLADLKKVMDKARSLGWI